MARTGVCCIVASNDCKAAANQETLGPVGQCWQCGDDVCTDAGCSRRVTIKGKRVRVCEYCQEQNGGLRG